MKTILCYGDSNTWRFDPERIGQPVCRFSLDERWTGRLQNALGEGYHIVEEGLGGRTTVFEDPTAPGRSGLAWLLPCMQSHQPLDLIVLMLGTNDTKTVFHAPAQLIAAGLERLVQTVLCPFHWDSRQPPSILIVSPPPIGDDIGQSWLRDFFDRSSVEKSGQLAELYRNIAAAYSCHFLDAADIAATAPGESVHLGAAAHRALANAVAAQATAILR